MQSSETQNTLMPDTANTTIQRLRNAVQTAAAESSKGEMSGRNVTSLMPFSIEQGNQLNPIVENIITALANALIGPDSLYQLQCFGLLQVQVHLKNNLKQDLLPSHVTLPQVQSWNSTAQTIHINLENIDDVSTELKAQIQKRIMDVFKPKALGMRTTESFKFFNINPCPEKPILFGIDLILSDIRKKLLWSGTGEVVSETEIEGFHRHSKGVNHIQDILSETEFSHQAIPVDEDKVARVANEIVSNLEKQLIKRKKAENACLKIVCNSNTFSPQRLEKKWYHVEYIANLSLAELKKLFAKLKSEHFPNIQPVFNYVVQEVYGSVSGGGTSKAVKQMGQGIAEENKLVIIADYDLKLEEL
jgi:hypothetical protein